ncbi:ABC transporter permease subunit [Ruminococcaceae bacterium OttesenSCG-928-L11]|nr:ABC transporter permease subunit [Ruminococcaceae bacterium OttesenSCG-928-L11]
MNELARGVSAPATKKAISRRAGLWKRIKLQRTWLLFLLPAFCLVLLFNYIPMVGLVMAFQNYRANLGWFGSEFVGFTHFRAFLTDPEFYQVLGNTLKISILLLVFAFPAPILLALCLDNIRNEKFKKVTQTISYLPHFISWVVMAGLVYRILDVDTGIINVIVRALGGDPIPFMRSPEMFVPIVVVVDVLKEVGWNSIIFLAAITNIDPSLYDAATVDGAGKLKTIRYITLPGIGPTIGTMLILRVGSMMNVNFDMIFNLRNPMVNNVANVLGTFVYEKGILRGQFPYATAVGLVQGLVSVFLVFFSMRVANKVSGESYIV